MSTDIRGDETASARENRPLLIFRKLALSTLLLILVFVVFCNTLANGFVFDDSSMIKHNAAIKSPRHIKAYFTRPFFSVGRSSTGPVQYDYYRPLVLLSYLADYTLWNDSPAGFHLTNIFLQSLTAVFLFLVLHKLGLSLRVSFLAAVFWAIHPALVDSVASVSGRSDLLCALFLLAGFFCYLTARLNPGRARRRLLAASFSAFALALLAKENAIVFPLILTAYELVLVPGRRPADKLARKLNMLFPAYGVAILYVLWRSRIVHMRFQAQDVMEPARRLATAVVIAADYLLKAFFPHDLYLETFVRDVEAASFKFLLSAALMLIVVMAAAIFRKRSAPVSFFICWFFIFLAPFSYLFFLHPAPLFTPPHFLYFPLMGLAAVAAIGGEAAFFRLGARKRMAASAAACAGAVGILLAIQAISRNSEWHDEFTFFASMLRHNPQTPRTYIGMGNVFLERGQPGYAAAQYGKAFVFAKAAAAQDQPVPEPGEDPQVGTLTIANYYAAAARTGIGDAYLALREMPDAIAQYELAVGENGFDATILYRLGRAYEFTGDFDKALASYERALRLSRNMAGARLSRQVALKKKEVYDQAKRVYLTSLLSGAKRSVEARYGEALMLRLSGKQKAAEAVFREVVAEVPMHFGANLALGQILAERGLDEEAFGAFSAAFAAEPSSAVAAKELALASLILDDAQGAVQWAVKAYELAPNDSSRQFAEDMKRLTESARETRAGGQGAL